MQLLTFADYLFYISAMQPNPLNNAKARQANPLLQKKTTPGTHEEGHPNNILSWRPRKRQQQVIEEGKEWFRNAFEYDYHLMPRAMNYASQAVSALVEANYTQGASVQYDLLHVMEFFANKDFRDNILKTCANSDIIEAYDPDHGSYCLMSDRMQMEKTLAITRALQPLANDAIYRA